MRFYSKILSVVFTASFFALVQTSYAAQTDEGLDQVCDTSGGSWHSNISGWACCWHNWGCYGCNGGDCLMNCHSQKCTKSNSLSKASLGQKEVPELAPKNTKAPIVPEFEAKQPMFKANMIKELKP